MIHLFKKTYLDLDFFIDTSQERIVISEKYGYQMDLTLQAMYDGVLLANGQSFEEVVGPEKTFSSVLDLFQFCFSKNQISDRRLVINCDKTTYLKLSCHWFKAIFNNIDVDSAFRMIKTNLLKVGLYSNKTSNYWYSSDYLSAIPSKEEFTQIFNSVQIDLTEWSNLVQQANTFLSHEYFMASYLFNGSQKENLKATLKLFMHRLIQSAALDMQNCIKMNVLQEHFRSTFGLNPYTLDNLEELVNDPALTLLKKASDNVNQLSSTDFQNLKDFLENFIVRIIDNGVIESGERSKKYLDILKNEVFSDSDLDLVINWEINPVADNRLWVNKDRANVNFYLLDYIYNAKKTNQIELLQPYVLR